ncbi:MAG: hypothetical protein RLZZ342_525 [Candidatus Parcubacteria bacterium]|jgi:SAM-dependent methyltransferase
MDKKQKIQDDEYSFPYHYLPSLEGGAFSLSRHLYWGHTYISYIRHLCRTIKALAPERVLDVGCGDGRLLYELRSALPDAELVGLDYSERPLLFARAFGYGKNLTFKQSDIATAPEEGYDVVTLIEVLEHIPPEHLDNFLAASVRALAPQGTLILTVPSDKTAPNHKHYQHFSEEMLRTICTRQSLVVEKVEFLTALGVFPAIIRRLFSNRLFLLNEKHLLTMLYRWYEQSYLIARKETADRILFITRRA